MPTTSTQLPQPRHPGYWTSRSQLVALTVSGFGVALNFSCYCRDRLPEPNMCGVAIRHRMPDEPFRDSANVKWDRTCRQSEGCGQQPSRSGVKHTDKWATQQKMRHRENMRSGNHDVPLSANPRESLITAPRERTLSGGGHHMRVRNKVIQGQWCSEINLLRREERQKAFVPERLMSVRRFRGDAKSDVEIEGFVFEVIQRLAPIAGTAHNDPRLRSRVVQLRKNPGQEYHFDAIWQTDANDA